MKIVIAPDSFKGSLSALEAARAMKEGVLRACRDAVAGRLETEIVPMADGGEGTVEAVLSSAGGTVINADVTGPLGVKVRSFYGILSGNRTAVIEMAAASGLTLAPEGLRDPMISTSYGTGELIINALDMGCRKLLIGIGGSATIDGGTGMLMALGAGFYDKTGREIPRGGGGLISIGRIDISGLDPRIQETEIVAACDVKNPLCGPFGAAAVFGPQKGAAPEVIPLLDEGLAHFAGKIHEFLKIEVKDIPGSGAAGGMGASLLAFLGAKIMPGIELIADATGLEEKIRNSDLILTGEGSTDSQTAFGKVPAGIGKIASKYGVPVICISGGIGEGAQTLCGSGIRALFGITGRPMDLSEAMKNAYELVSQTAENVIRTVLLGYSIKGFTPK
ncbi:MAG: glycerate kinase [Brevinematales bacterium]|jgi:glycerate kinase